MKRATTSRRGVGYLLRRGAKAQLTDEYNVKLRRLFPWPKSVETHRRMSGFGVIWVTVPVAGQVDEHQHDEEESFFILSGEATITVNEETFDVSAEDVVYIPRFAKHSITNKSTEHDFIFVDVYWDNPEWDNSNKAK